MGNLSVLDLALSGWKGLSELLQSETLDIDMFVCPIVTHRIMLCGTAYSFFNYFYIMFHLIRFAKQLSQCL